MRFVSATNCAAVLDHFAVERQGRSAIDVGGTDRVWLMRGMQSRVERNPVLDLVPGVRLLDRGFNEDDIGAATDDRLDFLEPVVAERLAGQFDLVFCFDTLEHVSNPFRFCEHLVQVAKPGGFVYVSTLFRFVYHPSPQDYFRYTPDGLRQCFTDAANARHGDGTVLWSGWESDDYGVALLYYRGHDRRPDPAFTLPRPRKTLTQRVVGALHRRVCAIA